MDGQRHPRAHGLRRPALARHRPTYAAPRRDLGGTGEQWSLYGWRFQATDSTGTSYVFDVYREEAGWHVHRAYC
jgi:hypothetical protein